MDVRKLAVALLLGTVFLGLFHAAAYEGGGGKDVITACTDGSDNDGDGLTDGDDPGCVRPYDADDSEADLYDLDATWVFANPSDDNSLTESEVKMTPSTFFGWTVEKASGASFGDSMDGSSLNETYVKNSDRSWGGGTVAGTLVDITDSASIQSSRGFPQLINPPGGKSAENCGDGIPDSGEDKVNCPEDLGMKDIVFPNALDGMGSPQSDVYYDVDDADDEMKCYEITDDGRYPPVSEVDLTDGSDETISLGPEKNNPDYIVDVGALGTGDNDRIMAVDCVESSDSPTTIDTVTDHYLTTSEEPIAGSGTTAYTDPGSSGSGQSTYCTDSTTAYEASLTTETKTTNVNAKMIGVGSDASVGGKKVVSSNSVDVSYKWNDGHDYTGSSYEKCTSSTSYYDSCSSTEEMRSRGFSCSNVEVTDVMGYSTETKNTGSSSRQVSIKYRDYGLSTSEIYDVSKKSDAVGTVTVDDPSGSDSPYDKSDFVFSNGAFFTDKSAKSNSYNMGNDPAVSRSAFKMDVASDDNFFVNRDEFASIDADGPNGRGDGFVAADEESGGNNIVATVAEFATREVSGGSVSNSYLSTGNVPNIGCPGDFLLCTASVDLSVPQTGWVTAGDIAGMSATYDITVKDTNQSLSTCMMYKTLTGDPDVNCRYQDPNGNNDGPTGGGTRTCGDQAGEYWAYMEGPEINQDLWDDRVAHYQGCIDTNQAGITRSACIINGETVPEGSVYDVGAEDSDYERGGHSPDWEVCLDLEGTGIGNEGDRVSGDNHDGDGDDDGTKELSDPDNGGEWYDLDSWMAQEYLSRVYTGTISSGSGRSLVSDPRGGSQIDSNGDGSTDENDIDYYWEYDPGVKDSSFNPSSDVGLTVEDDCGNPRFDSGQLDGCSDAAGDNTRSGYFWSRMEESSTTYRDDDYHPQGFNQNAGDAKFTGYVNRIQDLSNQLEPDMNTSNYFPPDVEIWSDSDGSADSADVFGYSISPSWSISNRGTPYPPYATYYRQDGQARSGPESRSVPKTFKVFGNSYAAVAGAGLDDTEDENGNTITTGDGVWIDPDQLREAWNSGNYQWPSSAFTWTDELEFKMDITGPDSGLGYDNGDGSSLNFKSSSQKEVVWGDIYFEGEYSGSVNSKLEKPMCGDDQKEFLLEEMGESIKSRQYDGAYACASRRDVCVDKSATPRIISSGSYRQTDEPDEEVGRLKNDEEYCGTRSSDNMYLWYDQDYGDLDGDGNQDTCRVNNLYGESGVRWFDSGYINNYPEAVKGGIDDDWNAYLEQEGHADVSSSSPVPTGSPNKSIATLGFCGGDDGGEYIVTQDCNTELCETKRSVIGVKKNPDSCIFDRSESKHPVKGYSSGDPERVLYQPGDTITFDMAEDEKIACFNGRWYQDWPIVFHESSVEVPLGEEKSVPFDVINVRNQEMSFKVELEPGSEIYRFSRFEDTDADSFTATVGPQSSKTYSVVIRGNDVDIDSSDLYVQADAVNSEMFGEDSVTVDVVNRTDGKTGVRVDNPKSVPGIGFIHVMVLMMMGTAVFFLQN